jgi:hypothetical protein
MYLGSSALFSFETSYMINEFLRFTATGAPLAARRIQILPMNQHA